MIVFLKKFIAGFFSLTFAISHGEKWLFSKDFHIKLKGAHGADSLNESGIKNIIQKYTDPTGMLGFTFLIQPFPKPTILQPSRTPAQESVIRWPTGLPATGSPVN
jgi:hypothetical protein